MSDDIAFTAGYRDLDGVSKPLSPHAFPSRQPNEHILYPDTYHTGMTLRDYFAAVALPTVYAVNAENANFDPDVNAREAYAFADAMMKAREEPR